MWPFSTLIRDNAAAAEAEERSAIDFSAFSDLLTPSYSGVPVSQGTSVNLPAVYKCVSLNSETISSLPLDVFAKRGKARVPYAEPVWFRPPNNFQTLREVIAMTQASLDLDGNAFWFKIMDAQGRLAGIEVLDPAAVSIEVVGGRLTYWITTANAREPYSANEVVHLRALVMPGQLRGLSPIECAKQTIGIGLAAEQFGGQFFGNGANLSGVIESTSAMTKEQADRLKADFTKSHGGVAKSHAIGVLTNATWKPMSVKPDEAQFLEARRYTAGEIANLYGVPVEFVGDGSTQGAKGYVTGVSMRFRMWYLTGLMPRITRIEEALTGLMPRGVYIKFNTYALLRMDPAEQTAFFAAGQLGEYITRNEIRAWLELDPVDGGDDFLHSVQWQENAPPDGGDTETDPEPASAGSSVKEPAQ